MNKEIFTMSSAQDVSLDTVDVEEIEFQESVKGLKVLIHEMIRAEHLRSPLQYNRSPNTQRISLLDDESPEFKKGDVYFSPTKKYSHYGDSGRRLKTPRTEEVPGAAPGTVAFLDYHVLPGGTVYIDYMKTRNDMRGQGHAGKLVDELLRKFGKDVTYDFGHIMNPAAGKIQKKLASLGYNVRGWHDY
jgi:hypothetical protein